MGVLTIVDARSVFLEDQVAAADREAAARVTGAGGRIVDSPDVESVVRLMKLTLGDPPSLSWTCGHVPPADAFGTLPLYGVSAVPMLACAGCVPLLFVQAATSGWLDDDRYPGECHLCGGQDRPISGALVLVANLALTLVVSACDDCAPE